MLIDCEFIYCQISLMLDVVFIVFCVLCASELATDATLVGYQLVHVDCSIK